MKFVDAIRNTIGLTKKSEDRSGVSPLLTRPVDSFVQVGVHDVAKVPMLPLHFRFAYDMFFYSDVIRTIVRSIVWETFRNGIIIKRKFAVKCNACGAEYENEEVKECEICGSKNFRRPDNREKLRLEKFVKDANLNDESLIDVLMSCDYDLNIVDNAFLVVTKKYYFDEDGRVIGAEPIEVIRGSPLTLYFVMSRDGRMGVTDDGRVVVFCLEHRDVHYEYTQEEVERGVRCPKCGKIMYPAYFKMFKGGRTLYYTNGEVLHFKKFTQGIGYGFPPVITVWMKAMILMKQDWFIMMSYHLQRPPKGLLVVRGNMNSVAKAWEWLMEKARINPHAIYPLIVEGTDSSKRVVEWIDFTFKSDDINFIEYRNELRRSIGAVWGVMPLFHADVSTGTGLANEGLQITVTNRAIEVEQNIYNNKVLPWLCRQLGINDWVIQLKPHEEKDLASQLQRILMRIQIASGMKGLGYEPIMVEGEDGIDFKYTELEPEEKLKKFLKEFANKYGLTIEPDTLLKEFISLLEKKTERDNTERVGELESSEEHAEGMDEVVGVVGEGGKLIPEPEQKLEGEPSRSRSSRRMQRFEGEPEMPRR